MIDIDELLRKVNDMTIYIVDWPEAEEAFNHAFVKRLGIQVPGEEKHTIITPNPFGIRCYIGQPTASVHLRPGIWLGLSDNYFCLSAPERETKFLQDFLEDMRENYTANGA